MLSVLRYTLCAVLLAGCATPCCVAPNVPTPQTVVTAGTKLKAVGHGNASSYSQYTVGQRKLMAMRAAQADAYRNLAEQVYGFHVRGTTAVSAFSTQSDSIRSHVDAFIRGARLVHVTSIGDENFEAVVELDMTPQFVNCFAPGATCWQEPAAPASCVAPGCAVPACAVPGCAGASAIYTSY